MPKTGRIVRVHNPGKTRKKPMTAKQIRFFGTKAQKAALGMRTSNRARGKFSSVGASAPNRKLRKTYKSWNKAENNKKNNEAYNAKRNYYADSSRRRSERIGNPGEIITLTGLGFGNPGTIKKEGKNMAKRRKSHRKATAASRRTRRTRRKNPTIRTVVRYRTKRRKNSGRTVRVGRRRYARRRKNSGTSTFLSGNMGMLVGIFGGVAVTSALSNRLPAGLNTGIAGYLATAAVAYVQGMLAGKLLKNPTLGKNMTTGGLIYLGIKLVGDYFPGITLPLGLGAIASRDPYSVPQIPVGNSMVRFQPSNVPTIAAAKGMGRIARMGKFV